MNFPDNSLKLPSSVLVQLAATENADTSINQKLLETIRALFDARSALILERHHQEGKWRVAGAVDGTREILTLGAHLLETIADRSTTEAACLIRGGAAGAGRALIALTLGAGQHYIQVAIMTSVDSPDLPRAVACAGPLVQLAADAIRLRGAIASNRLENERLSRVVDIVGRIDGAQRFADAAQEMIDNLCHYIQAGQVSLCWKRGNAIRLIAVSHMDSIPRRTELARLMEEAVNEALQQGRELLWPAVPGDTAVAVALSGYVRECGTTNIVIVPIGRPGFFIGALVVEGTARTVSEPELWLLRLLADHAVTPLTALHQAEQPLVARLGRELARGLGIMSRLTAGRLLAAAVCLVTVTAASMLPLEHRVHAPIVLRTDRLAQVGAPFDGFIHSVLVQVGEAVTEGQVLFRMKTRELLLERASALADIAQYEREAQKHQATGAGADMRIALAQADQSRARLHQIDFRIESAEVRSPIHGVIVEGDLPQQIGAPLRRGEPGFRLAGNGGLYAEILVNESDIGFVRAGMGGEITLVGQPSLATSIQISRIVPLASTQGGENIVPVRANAEHIETWWRPGMTGVARLDAGRQPLWWLATRRLLDFARLQLWW